MKRAVIVIFLLGVLVSRVGQAQGRSDKDWQNNVFVYGLATAISGDARFGPLESPVDISFSDILDNLEGGFMGRYRGSNERFSVVADFIYLNLGNDKDSGLVRRGDLEQLVVEITGAYRFSPIFEALFGVRITDLSTSIRLERPISGSELELGGSDTFYDPIFGARLSTSLDENQKWWLQAHGDIGGFGVGMDFTWQVMANVGWKPAQWISIWGGYRALGQDFDNAGDREKFGATLTYFGPQFGVGFHF